MINLIYSSKQGMEGEVTIATSISRAAEARDRLLSNRLFDLICHLMHTHELSVDSLVYIVQ